MIMPYGIKVTAYRERPESGSYWVREFDAPGRAEAIAAVRSWLMVEGYDVERSVIEVVADGMTLADHMSRELVNMAARMSLRYGATMDGPHTWTDGGGDKRAAVKLWMPNGRGVSVSSKLDEFGFIRSEFAAIREDATDRHGWVFDKTAQHYPEGTSVGEGYDGDVSDMLTRIGTLPRK
jgi:hypothetical protein